MVLSALSQRGICLRRAFRQIRSIMFFHLHSCSAGRAEGTALCCVLLPVTQGTGVIGLGVTGVFVLLPHTLFALVVVDRFHRSPHGCRSLPVLNPFSYSSRALIMPYWVIRKSRRRCIFAVLYRQLCRISMARSMMAMASSIVIFHHFGNFFRGELAEGSGEIAGALFVVLCVDSLLRRCVFHAAAGLPGHTGLFPVLHGIAAYLPAVGLIEGHKGICTEGIPLALDVLTYFFNGRFYKTLAGDRGVTGGFVPLCLIVSISIRLRIRYRLSIRIRLSIRYRLRYRSFFGFLK